MKAGKKKKILILGAGVNQLSVIRQARAMDMEAVVCSRPGPYQGIGEAARFYPTDTTDIEGCIAIAREENIDGVLCPGTDVAMPALGAINDALGLPGPGYKAALMASDKLLMKKAFAENGVRTAAFSPASCYEEAMQAAHKIGFPLVVKVPNRSGSRGVEIVGDPAGFGEAYNRCLAVGAKNGLIVEAFLQGEEFGAQSFVRDGRILFVMPHGDIVRRTEHGQVPVGHYVPYGASSELVADIEEQITRCVNALGLNDCAINMDFTLVNGKAYVLEIGARVGATCLCELVSLYYSINYDEFMIRTACGELMDCAFAPTGNAAAAMLLFSEQDGILEGVSFPEHPAPGLVQAFVDYPPGTPVSRFRAGPDRIGHVIFKVETAAEAMRALEGFLKETRITVRPV